MSPYHWIDGDTARPADAGRGEEARPLGTRGRGRDVHRNGLCRSEYGSHCQISWHHQASLYARYPDKRAVVADVIPWALARYTDDGSIGEIDDDDLETALLAVGRVAMTLATHPQNVRLKRIAFNEAAQFAEFNVSAESMMWAGRQRAVTELLRRHEELGTIKVDDLELAAEHFLAMVEAVPARMADFGVFRSPKQQERPSIVSAMAGRGLTRAATNADANSSRSGRRYSRKRCRAS